MGNILSISLSCDPLLSRCSDCVASEALYTCRLQENLASLKLAVSELRERRSDVLRRVTMAERAGDMKRLDQVEGWLSRTDTMINDVDRLIKDDRSTLGEVNKYLNIGCLCSKSCKSTHRFSKRVANRLVDVRDLMDKGAAFEDQVAMPLPPPPMVERPTSDSAAVGMESVLDEVKSSIGDKDVGIIGIYGKGGVGKTRLMTEINNNIATFGSNQFDVVIWVVVSKGFSTGKVQDDIAERLGLRSSTDQMWDKKTAEEKATKIFRDLSRRRFALLLDDIWERIDLSKVGIPFPTEANGSKLIFSTRSFEVCGKMRAGKKIQVTCLPEEKAWELFEQHVGSDHVLHSNPEILELARDVAKECGGLPLALITIGRAMACKTKPEEWK